MNHAKHSADHRYSQTAFCKGTNPHNFMRKVLMQGNCEAESCLERMPNSIETGHSYLVKLLQTIVSGFHSLRIVSVLHKLDDAKNRKIYS